jgi:hypothetical protein
VRLHALNLFVMTNGRLGRKPELGLPTQRTPPRNEWAMRGASATREACVGAGNRAEGSAAGGGAAVKCAYKKCVGPGASRFGAWVQVARACAARAGVGTWAGRGALQAGQTVENGCGDALTFWAG